MAWLTNTARRIKLRNLSAFLAILLAIPLGWKGLTGFYTWLSPFIMLNSVFALKSVVWLNSLALAILILAFFRKRWFCRNICPVGWSCDLISDCSRCKNFSVRAIPPVGKWLALISISASLAGIPLFILLDPMSVFNGFFSVLSGNLSTVGILSLLGLPLLLTLHLFLPGIWCARLCPLGGLQDELSEIKNLLQKNQNKEKDGIRPDSRRRLFLASGAGLVAGFLTDRILPAEGNNFLRPPGAVPPKLFNIICLRCGNCIKACPTGILSHQTGSGDAMAWLVPEIIFDKGYCLESCNLCSRICPSGAITLFSPGAKSQLKIGSASVTLGKCLLTGNSECDRCKTACPYEAITIEPDGESLQMRPVVDPDKCNGCGACAVICPPGTIRIIPV